MTDHRETAYLDKSNWPDAIPWTGPGREHGPEPWPVPDHDDRGLDDYPSHHIDAMSVGDAYGGDVCPWCGVPERYGEDLVTADGREGTIATLGKDDVTVPLYHPHCYREREAEIHGHENTSLEEWS